MNQTEGKPTGDLNKIDNQAQRLADFFGGKILNSEPEDNN